MIEPLRAFLMRALGARAVDVTGLRPMTGGATRETYQFDAAIELGDAPQHSKPLVLVCFRPFGNRSFSPTDEFHLLQSLYGSGVPTPRPVAMGDDSLGRPFFIVERIAGETIGRRIVRDDRLAAARPGLTAELGAALARIHALDIATPDLGFLPGPAADRSGAEHELVALEALYRQVTVDPHPVFELAFRWLHQHLPRTRERVLVHGDFRIGNVIVGEEGLRCVLDWELAHVGDPAEDLGWLCVRSWRFGRDDLPVGGVGERETLLGAYARAGGRPVDAERVRSWEIYGNLRWGVFTLVQVRAFLEGLSPSVELASIGRRAAETEDELLRLIGGR